MEVRDNNRPTGTPQQVTAGASTTIIQFAFFIAQFFVLKYVRRTVY
jgi:hypothetical protein